MSAYDFGQMKSPPLVLDHRNACMILQLISKDNVNVKNFVSHQVARNREWRMCEVEAKKKI